MGLDIYSMPADGSALPSAVDTEAGHIVTLLVPVQGADLIWGLENPIFSIRKLPVAGGSAATLIASTANSGTFIATAATVYYETWVQTNNAAANTVTRSGTQAGIVGIDGTVVQAPLAETRPSSAVASNCRGRMTRRRRRLPTKPSLRSKDSRR